MPHPQYPVQRLPQTPDADAAEALKLRLRRDLSAAMRGRLTSEILALRNLIAALDNAQSVPVGDRHERYVVHPFGGRSAEVPRLCLDADAVRRLLVHEIDERLAAVTQMTALDRPADADRLRAETVFIARYVDDGVVQ